MSSKFTGRFVIGQTRPCGKANLAAQTVSWKLLYLSPIWLTAQKILHKYSLFGVSRYQTV